MEIRAVVLFRNRYALGFLKIYESSSLRRNHSIVGLIGEYDALEIKNSESRLADLQSDDRPTVCA